MLHLCGRAAVLVIAIAPVATSLAIGACTEVTNQPSPDPAAALSETVFRCNVEPILVRQCSYNACHGIAGTALRLYSPGKLRATTPTDIDDAIATLTTAEEHGNFESAAGFSFDTPNPDDNWLLRKPLASAQGGYEHKGGVIWGGGKTDAQYVAIRAWLAGTGVCP